VKKSKKFLVLSAAVAVALSVVGTAAKAIPIEVSFNFVPNGTLTANTGDVTTATTITNGAPDTVTTILPGNNIGLVSGQAINLFSNLIPDSLIPVTGGAQFFKSFSTPLGTFLETLVITLVTPGPSSLGITAQGFITQTVGSGFDTTPVFYSASYTQNQGPGTQINGSFNNATTPVPGPIVGAGLPGLIAACGGLLMLARRRRKLA
jgi:hypothetical protein